MLLELLLVVTIYVLIGYVLMRYKVIIKAMTSMLSSLPDVDEVVNTPEEEKH